jgi:hypothetical protein
MKIAVILLLIIIIAAGAFACATEIAAPASPSMISNPASSPGVFAVPYGTIFFNQAPDIITQPGKNVEIKLTFTNFGMAARVMRNYPPEIKIESRNLPFTNNKVRTFTPGQEQLELQSEESKEYVLTWDQMNDSGRQVPYGWYGVRANIFSREITDTRSMQGSEAQIMRVLVLPPGGVMEKDIELDQSKAANGITVNLEKLEMKSQGAELSIMCIPDHYELKKESTHMTGTDAQYKVDNEEWKPAIRSEFGTILLEEGVRYIWDLDPVPQNAREITFRINKMEDRLGPWEFVIQL